MPKITNRMITDRWIAAFQKDKPFSPSEKRMMGIKLAQLKKSIKKHIEETGRQTDLSVEQIVMDTLEYSVMTNRPYRSIASLGYEVLEPSLDYWEKRRKLEGIKREEEVSKAKEEINSHNSNVVNSNKVDLEDSYKKPKDNTPSWMNNNDW